MAGAAASCAEPSRRRLRLVAGLGGLALLSMLTACNAADDGAGSVEELPFDFYVLSLSWSPSYCAAEGADADPLQCDARPAHAFIVHGLWPQFEEGWPEYCGDGAAPEPSPDLVGSMLDIMPSRGLVAHQWEKHGTCTGLAPAEYFATTRDALERVELPELMTGRRVDPDAVEQDFLDSNPDMPAEGIAVTCDDERLREVRICLGADLGFRPCPEVDARSCQKSDVAMPPPGG